MWLLPDEHKKAVCGHRRAAAGGGPGGARTRASPRLQPRPGARGPQLPPEPGMQGCSAVQGRGVRLGRPPGGGGGSPNEGSVEVARAGQGGVKAATAPGAGPAGARPVAEQLRNLFS